MEFAIHWGPNPRRGIKFPTVVAHSRVSTYIHRSYMLYIYICVCVYIYIYIYIYIVYITYYIYWLILNIFHLIMY